MIYLDDNNGLMYTREQTDTGGTVTKLLGPRFAIVNIDGTIRQIVNAIDCADTITDINAQLSDGYIAVGCGPDITMQHVYTDGGWVMGNAASIPTEPQKITDQLAELKENQLILMDAIATLYEAWGGK